MKILFLSFDVWNFYKIRQDLASSLAKYYNCNCLFVEPIVYKNPSSIRLADLSKNNEARVRVIKRKSNLIKGLRLFVFENIDNIRQIKRYQPEVVVSDNHLTCFFAAIYCKLKKIKFIYDQMDNWPEVEKNKLIKFYLRRLFYPLVGKISFATANTSHYLKSIMDKYGNRNFIIPNGKSLEDINEFRQDIKTDSLDVNFIASLRDWYDYDLLIDVFKNFPQLRLNIYGTGKMEDYIRQAIKTKKSENVFLRGSLDGSLVPKFTAESRFGIIPLKINDLNKGTCPIKLFDYWSASKVVISTPFPEIEIIGQGICYIEKTKNGWVKAINRILNNSVENEKIGAAAYKKVMNEFNYKVIAGKFYNLINGK